MSIARIRMQFPTGGSVLSGVGGVGKAFPTFTWATCRGPRMVGLDVHGGGFDHHLLHVYAW